MSCSPPSKQKCLEKPKEALKEVETEAMNDWKMEDGRPMVKPKIHLRCSAIDIAIIH